MRLGSIAKVLAQCKLKYDRISEFSRRWCEGTDISTLGVQATMYVASCVVDQEVTGKALSTGYPLANTHIYILDEGLNPLPIGTCSPDWGSSH